MTRIKIIGATLLLFATSWFLSKALFPLDLIGNFEHKQFELRDLVAYVKGLPTEGDFISLEFKNDYFLEYFHIKKDSQLEEHWDIRIESESTQTLLKKLGWTQSILNNIKEKLNRSRTISVEWKPKGNLVIVGYERSGLGKYSYLFYDQSTPLDSITQQDGCKFSYFKDRVVLEYADGAIGDKCL